MTRKLMWLKCRGAETKGALYFQKGVEIYLKGYQKLIKGFKQKTLSLF
jgi:hypothetical protein